VKWTGTEANATIGHGLSTAPKLILIKNASAAKNWTVYAQPAGATHYAKLNLTDAFQDADTAFNDTHPTSSVFSVGSASVANGNGNTMIAYCFSDVNSYQKIGTFNNVGSTGTVNLGFKPRFVMVKTVDTTDNWRIYDSQRDSDGINNKELLANSSNAEYTLTNFATFTSTGLDFTGGNSFFHSGKFLYLAIA